MNLVGKILPDLICFRLGKPQLESRCKIPRSSKLDSTRSKWNLLLGMIAALVALPIITLIVMSSVFFPQQKWEEFWDLFLEEN